MELLFCASGDKNPAPVMMELKRAHAQVFRGRGHAEDRDLLHAAVQIADLWAFETGRLP